MTILNSFSSLHYLNFSSLRTPSWSPCEAYSMCDGLEYISGIHPMFTFLIYDIQILLLRELPLFIYAWGGV